MIEFDSPLALATLLVPFLVALMLLSARRPPPVTTGTLEVWREVSPEAAAQPRRRGSPPLFAWALIASLCAACLALAGPRLAGASEARWRVVVDRSPSMYERTDDGTRLDRALAALREQGLANLEYVAASGAFVTAPVVQFPEEWRRAPAGRWHEPDWAALDDAGMVWLTDAAELAPARASLIAAGRDSASDVRQPLRRFMLDSELDATPFGRAVLAWAQARGYERAGDEGSVALAVKLASGAGERPIRCEGSGWALSGSARWLEAPKDAPSDAVLRTQDGPLVLAQPGRWDVGLLPGCRLEGDDVAFALEITGKLDRAAVGDEDLTPVSAPRVVLGSSAPPSRPQRSYSALLATLAALLSGLAIALRERSS